MPDTRQVSAPAARGSILSSPPGSDPVTDSSIEAQGRRILSTAFVRLGPDGHLTVERHDGRTLVLRDVVMGAKDYCGAQVAGDPALGKYCGGYAEVAAARPGGAPPPDQPDQARSLPDRTGGK